VSNTKVSKYLVLITLPGGVKLIAPDFETSWDARDWIEAVSSREKYMHATFEIQREREPS